MKAGVYIDLPRSLVEKNIDKIRQLEAVDHWLLMIEDVDGRRIYDEKGARLVSDLLERPGIGWTPITPVIWPAEARLTREYIEWVKRMEVALRAKTCRADLEGNWKNASDLTANTLLRELRPQVTTTPGHRESSRKSQVGRYTELLEIQAYSTRTLLKRTPAALPGAWQEACYKDGLAAYGKPPALALPAYHQTGIADASGRLLDPARAMRVAYEAARDVGAVEANYWSLRHILGVPYAWRFMTTILPTLRG